MTIKKRSDGESTAPAKRKAKRKASEPAVGAKRTVARPVAKSPAKPRIRSSYANTPDAPASSPRAVPPLKAAFHEDRPSGKAVIRPKTAPAVPRKPLTAPKRLAKRPAPVSEAQAVASSAARELALALAAAGIDKKAVGIEILDVVGKIDYADFLVVMTGRSDRHVHSIATGIEEAMRKRKLAPLSIEGLSAATWVLIDFGDVVVHVFQEDARALYDIEGLWIDASRVPVPAEDAQAPKPPPGAG